MTQATIQRDLESAAARRHDLLVIGGGIHGVMLTLEAARRGLTTTLVEQDDFGGAASANSLRIIHGGLRYLQQLDWARTRESAGEQAWFVRTMPRWVRPLACLMPLYNRGVKRVACFRMAQWMYRRVVPAQPGSPPHGSMLSAEAAAARCTLIPPAGLKGCALWHDAQMTNAPRVLMTLLRWACGHGAMALNYTRAERLIVEAGRAAGLEVNDRTTGGTHALRGATIVNFAGHWAGDLARTLDPALRHASHRVLLFNLLLDRPAISDAAVALTDPARGGRTYFFTPLNGLIFVGTHQVPWRPGMAADASPPLIDAMLTAINRAAPGLNATSAQVLRVTSGIMTTDQPDHDEPLHRAIVIDHARRGGPSGLHTVCGVKYTTARRLAQSTLDRLFGPAAAAPDDSPPPMDAPLDLTDPSAMLDDLPAALPAIGRLCAEESVRSIDDLLHRRTDWGLIPAHARRLRQPLGEHLRLPVTP